VFNPGDLVKPIAHCASSAPRVFRCKTAVVLEHIELRDDIPAPVTKILCACGADTVYSWSLESIIAKEKGEK